MEHEKTRRKKKLEEKEIVIQLLLGMPETYQSVVTALDILFSQEDKKMSLNFVKNKLLMEEQRQKKEVCEDNNNNAFVRQKPFRKKFSYYRNKKAHEEKREKGPSYVLKGKCFNCGNRRHKRSECIVRKKANVVQADEEEEISFMCLTEEDKEFTFDSSIYKCANLTFKNQKTISFVIDSGVTCHLIKTDFGDYLKNSKECIHKINVAKAGETVQSKKQGDLQLLNISGSEITLKNVLECENLVYNLISVKKMEEKGLKVVFQNGEVHVFKDKKCILSGERKGNMYVVNFKVNLYEAHTVSDILNCGIAEWVIPHDTL